MISNIFVKLMDEQACKAEKVFKYTGRIWVIVLDNCSIHRAKAVKDRWATGYYAEAV